MFSENFKKKIKNIADLILKYWALVGILIAVLGFGYKITLQPYKNITDKLTHIETVSMQNQQMTLKNTIWNEEIPTKDRATACDIYLDLGYNSFTKMKCEKILEDEKRK